MLEWFEERSATPILTDTLSEPRAETIVVLSTDWRSRSAIAIAWLSVVLGSKAK